ncbi:unnamed protein product [Symbiodinium necroappetens]|uniref:Uncharacterized protein n=1 Tax=Symbiodinium necroappetens TaxID=1628268 RepID=A0A813CQ49_9DINO|nr:unnamed protein product [Symbiodinium necroappetens]
MRLVPTIPLMSDWTKVGPAIDWFLSADFAGTLSRLVKDARLLDRAPKPAADAEDELHEKIDWARLAGRRLVRTQKMLESAEERLRRAILAVSIEPLRHVHSTFLKFAHAAADSESWPVLLNEVWTPTSKICSVLQYLSTLLAGQGSRLALVSQESGEISLQGWIRSRPQEAKAARQQFLLVAVGLHRRYEANILRYPFKLFGVADARRTAEHTSLCKDFFKTSPCCLPPGLARELRQQETEKSFIDELPVWRWLFLLSSLIIKLTIAGVERRHAVHKRSANPTMPFYLFSADSILAEARHQMMALDRLVSERKARAEAAARSSMSLNSELPVAKAGRKRARSAPASTGVSRGPGVLDSQPKRAKTQSPFELFRKIWLRNQGEIHSGPFNPASKEAWAACKSAFEALPLHQLENLKRQSEATRVAAHSSRVASKKRVDAPAVEGASSVTNRDGEAPESNPNAVLQDTKAATAVQRQQATQRPPLPNSIACQSLNSAFLEQATRKPQEALDQSRYPIPAAAVKERMSQKGYSKNRDAENFRLLAQQLASGPGVPDSVVYPMHCGKLCRNSGVHTDRVIDFHGRVVSALQSVVKDICGGAKEVPNAGILFAAEQFLDPASPSPDAVTLVCLTEDAFAAAMCYVDLRPVEMLRVTLLDWEFEASFARLDTYRIVKTGTQISVEAAPEAPADDVVQPAPAAAAAVGEAVFVDLLADMEANRRHQGSQHSRKKRQRVVQAVLHDEFDPLALAVADFYSAEDGDAHPRQEELEDLEDEANLPNVAVEADIAPAAAEPDGENMAAEEDRPLRQEDVQLEAHPEAQAEAPECQPQYDASRDDLPIFDAGCSHFKKRSDETDVGRLHWMRDTIIKATCKQHRNCACMVEMPPERSARMHAVMARLGRRPLLEDIEGDLIAWLALVSTVTREQHQTAARNLKVQRWNVKVRQQR